MLLAAIRFFRGTVRFRIQGGFPERFINLCAHGGVPLWDGRRLGDSYTASTTHKGAAKIGAYAEKTGGVLSFEKRDGVPAIAKRYRKRVGLIAGVAVLLAALLFMGSFIWQIDIVGAQRISQKDILAVLSDLGVRRGTLRRSVDAVDVARQMMLRLPDLSWAAVNLRGSIATVEVRERVIPPKRVDDKTPFNVVSTRDGYITYMEVYEGQPTVKVGDSVLTGDILVSGIMEDKNAKSRTVHARAKIVAQTRETLTLTIPYSQENLTYRGLVVRKYFNLFSIRIPLFFGKEPEEPYKLERGTSKIPVVSMLAPVSLTQENYILINREYYTITEEEAKRLAEEQLPGMEAAAFETGKVLERELTGQATKEGFMLEGSYLVEWPIGEEREILLADAVQRLAD